MKNIISKVCIIVILISIFGSLLPMSNVFANSLGDFVDQGDDFLKSRKEVQMTGIEDVSSFIYNVLFTIAIVLAAAIGMIIGIQFILGSASEQAKIKETLIPYIIGVAIIFSAFTIWKIVINVGEVVAPTGTATSQPDDEVSTPVQTVQLQTQDPQSSPQDGFSGGGGGHSF